MGAGRPMKFEYDCRFCGEELTTECRLRRHWERTHHNICRVRAHYHTVGQYYYCPVTECDFPDCLDTKTIAKHLTNTGPHSVKQLLGAGVETWIVMKQTEKVI